MEIEIVEKKDNPILNRIEVTFQATHPNGATPKRDEVREKIAGMLSTKKSHVIVERMVSSFGTGMTRGTARVYPTTDDMVKIERLYLIKRNKLEDILPKKEEYKPAGEAKEA